MKIVNYPHPALRQVAAPLTSISKEIHLQVGQMFELMYENDGLGLAAPQVNSLTRLLVMNFSGDAKNKDHEFVAINPVIIEQKGSIEGKEGCLSFPGLFSKVRRARSVKVQAYNMKGELYEMTATDLAARVWQHEIDHLDGILFIDKLGMLGRINCKKSIQQFVHEFNNARKSGEIAAELEPIF